MVLSTTSSQCDSSSIVGAHVYDANEWGLDIVQGTDSVTLDGNYVAGSFYGGLVFDKVNTSGTVTNNQFIYNNNSNYSNLCNGINSTVTVSVTASGNSVNFGSLTCYSWGP